MEFEITAFYCLCDDFLISEGWRDDRQCAMSAAEVMTAALTAAAWAEFLNQSGEHRSGSLPCRFKQ